MPERRAVDVGVAHLPVGGVAAKENRVAAEAEDAAFEGVEFLAAPIFVVRAADHQPVGGQQGGLVVDVKIRGVVNQESFARGEFFQPADEEDLVFEEAGQRGAVKGEHGAARRVVAPAGIETIAAPVGVGLVGAGAEFEQNVPARAWGTDDDLGDMRIALAVGFANEIGGVITGRPGGGVDGGEGGRPVGAQRGGCDVGGKSADADRRADPHRPRGGICVVAKTVEFHPPARGRLAGTGGEHQVEALALEDAVAVDIAPDELAPEIGGPTTGRGGRRLRRGGTREACPLGRGPWVGRRVGGRGLRQREGHAGAGQGKSLAPAQLGHRRPQTRPAAGRHRPMAPGRAAPGGRARWGEASGGIVMALAGDRTSQDRTSRRAPLCARATIPDRGLVVHAVS